MKLATLLTLGATIAAAHAATEVTIKNFSGASGLPLVDNTGAVISKADLSWDVGSFDPAFAATLPTLDTLTSDAAVIAAFTSARVSTQDPGTFNFDGLFSGTLSSDEGNAFLGDDLYAIATHDLGGGVFDVMVFNFGSMFPQQDQAGNETVAEEVADGSEVVYGGVVIPITDYNTLPPTLQDRYSDGLEFNGIPEPSTGLLSVIAGLGLLARRRR